MFFETSITKQYLHFHIYPLFGLTTTTLYLYNHIIYMVDMCIWFWEIQALQRLHCFTEYWSESFFAFHWVCNLLEALSLRKGENTRSVSKLADTYPIIPWSLRDQKADLQTYASNPQTKIIRILTFIFHTSFNCIDRTTKLLSLLYFICVVKR